MKLVSILSLLLAAHLTDVQSVHINKRSSPEAADAADQDLDALMDKYDKNESDKNAKKKAQLQEKSSDPNKPSQSMIQDQELKILSGNNMAESSAKSGEDDVINEVLDKYTKKGKSGDEVITRDDAQDACNDIYEKLRGVDSYAAIDSVKEKFNKLWQEHDVTSGNILERSEMYALAQDITRM